MNENIELDNNEDTSIALVVLLEEVIELVNESKSMPFTSNIVVNRHRITELLKQAIDAVPDDVVTADRVVSEAEAVIEDANVHSEEIIEKARLQADEIIANAHERAKVLVSSERVIRLVAENADKIVAKAEENSRNLALGADSYCDERLNELEELLEVINRQIVAGREAIASRSGFDPELEQINVEQVTEENYSYEK